MANFPSIRDPHPELFSQFPYKKQLRNKMEDGIVISAARHTKMRWTFSLGWDALPDADYVSLYEFFEDYVGSSFNWTHFIKGTVHVVQFQDDRLPEATSIGGTHWALSGLILVEV